MLRKETMNMFILQLLPWRCMVVLNPYPCIYDSRIQNRLQYEKFHQMQSLS